MRTPYFRPCGKRQAHTCDVNSHLVKSMSGDEQLIEDVIVTDTDLVGARPPMLCLTAMQSSRGRFGSGVLAGDSVITLNSISVITLCTQSINVQCYHTYLVKCDNTPAAPILRGGKPPRPPTRMLLSWRARQQWCDFLAQLDFCPLEDGFSRRKSQSSLPT